MDATSGSTTPTAPAAITDQSKVQPTPTGGASGGTAGIIKEAAAEAARKLKIDDQDIDESEVVKVYKERTGHQRAANKAYQEGLRAKKQSEEFITMMKDKAKLFDVLKKLGHDPRQLSEEYLSEVLKEEMLPEHEKKLRNVNRELETYKERDKRAKEQAEAAQVQKLKAHFAEKYTAEFIEALKTTNLPPSKPMVGKMAEYIARASKAKIQMTAMEAAKLVEQDMDALDQHRLQQATPEQIAKMLGESGLKKLREWDIAKLRDPNAGLRTPAEQGEPSRERRTQTKRMTPEEWRAFNRAK